MGMYIIGGKPDRCGVCPCFHAENPMHCQAVKAAVQKPRIVRPYENGRPEWCPLIEVPEPHGRLGDLDRLEQMFIDIDNAPYSGFDGTEPFYSAEDAAQIIRLAPTIIPAEEGE